MTDERRFERTTRSWLELGPSLAPERVVRAALDEIERTGQDRTLMPAWVPAAPQRRRGRAAIVALAGVAAVLAILVALAGIGGGPKPGPAPSGGVVSSPAPSASPTSSPSEEPSLAGSPSLAASPESTSTPFIFAPAPTPLAGSVDLTDRFTSDRYGYSIGIGGGWPTKQASVTWTGPDNGPPAVDEIDVAGTDTTMTAASQALRPGQTFDAWLDAFQPPAHQGPCDGGAPETWPPITIGGEPGRWQQMCNAAEAVVEHDGRAYVFTWGNGTFDNTRHLPVGGFMEILDTIVFDASPIPTQPPPPPLPNTFTSHRNGFSVRYPEGWDVHRATGPLSQVVPPAGDPGWDTLQDRNLRLSIASAPLDPGVSDEAWAQTFCMFSGTSWSPPCAQVPGAWEPVTFGSATGWLATNGDSAGTYPTSDSRMFAATVVSGGRAYQVWLEGAAERELFLEILASMELNPAAASNASPQP